jgi:hypothetical protein
MLSSQNESGGCDLAMKNSSGSPTREVENRRSGELISALRPDKGWDDEDPRLRAKEANIDLGCWGTWPQQTFKSTFESNVKQMCKLEEPRAFKAQISRYCSLIGLVTAIEQPLFCIGRDVATKCLPSVR